MRLKLGCAGTARKAEMNVCKKSQSRKITFMGSKSRQEHRKPAKQEMSHNMETF